MRTLSEPRADADRARLDKWLWAARFYKTRSLAAQAIEAGQARYNEARVKPAHAVRVGDRITVRRDGLVWEVRVIALTDRRGSAADAAKLYTEVPESMAAREAEIAQRRAAAHGEPRFSGRPSKRQRRRLADFLESG